MKTLAILGAGPGLGFATARRFGEEGFETVLVSRNERRLKSFVDDLAGLGIEARGVAADLSDVDSHEDLVAELGPVDVALMNGFFDQEHIRAADDIDVASMRAAVERLVLAPLSLTRLLLPHMLREGHGAILYGLGASARIPMPPLGGVGSAQAALRNYALNLNHTLAEQGVYVGAMTIGALIAHSDAERIFDADASARRGYEPERADPADLADRLWTMYTERATAEHVVGPHAA